MQAKVVAIKSLGFIFVLTVLTEWKYAAAFAEELAVVDEVVLQTDQQDELIEMTLSDEQPLAERIAQAKEAPIDPVTNLPVGLDHEIARAAARGLVSVIVHFDPQLDTPNVAGGVSAVRQGLRNFVNQQRARIKYEYEVLPNAINVRDLPRAALPALKLLPGVVKVEDDEYGIYVSLHDSTPLIRGLQSQINGAGITADGTGVRVCVVDTGIDSDHVMFSSRIDAAAGFDFANDDSNPEDDNGHGSHCAGIALGRTGLTVDFGCVGPEPFQGVAPNATLIGVKVLNSAGGGFSSDIVAGINHCASTSLPGGQADVISLSLGTSAFTSTCDTHTWAIAANNAVAAGVTVAVATGNECLSNGTRSPACASNVIAVGATWDDNYPNCEDPTSSFNWGCCVDSGITVNKLVCFSNRASFIDVTAPGAMIYSASIAAGGGSIVGNAGTSMACPHVAGLAALILDVNPSLTPAQVRTIIQNGAVDLGTPGFDSSFGWGRIDVVNSLQLAGGGGCTTNGQCDDGLFCNGAETCVSGSCQAGTAPNCNDSIACTTDACNESTDSCTNTANNSACDDGLFCNGTETCNVTLGCQAGTNPCGAQQCNESTDTCGTGPEVWMAFVDSTAVPGVGTVENEDIVSYNQGSGTWSMILDGSDVGLSALAIDALARLSDGTILLSFADAGTVAGLTGGPSGTSVDDSDIVRFTPTSLGTTTAGSFSFYFDGSDVSLSTNNEDLDAVDVNASGQLILSTLGSFSVTGATGDGPDLVAFTPTSLGSVTAGSYSLYFDGSDVGLSAAAENVDASALMASGAILLSTDGNFSVPGLSGGDEDIFRFNPTTLGSTTAGSSSMYLDLSTIGIATAEDVAAIEIVE